MPGERTRIALASLPLVLLCATEGIVCAFVAFLFPSYAHTGRQENKRGSYINPQGCDSNVNAVIINYKKEKYVHC